MHASAVTPHTRCPRANPLSCPGGGSLSQQLFQGKQRDYVRCHACGSVSFTEDFFSNLSVDIPSNSTQSGDLEGGPRGKPRAQEAEPAAADSDGSGGDESASKQISVLSALRAALKPEQLVGDEQYECEKCKGKRDAERGVGLRVLPPILVLHLKRFASSIERDRKGRCRLNLVKLNTPLHFDMTLDMSQFVAQDDATESDVACEESPGDSTPSSTGSASGAARGGVAADGTNETGASEGAGGVGAHAAAATSPAAATAASPAAAAAMGQKAETGSLPYELYAVLIHSGALDKGHYFALIKDVETDVWHRFDDERVTRLPSGRLEAELNRSYGNADGADAATSAYMLFYRSMRGDAFEADSEECGNSTAAAGGATSAGAAAADEGASGATPLNACDAAVEQVVLCGVGPRVGRGGWIDGRGQGGAWGMRTYLRTCLAARPSPIPAPDQPLCRPLVPHPLPRSLLTARSSPSKHPSATRDCCSLAQVGVAVRSPGAAPSTAEEVGPRPGDGCEA